MGTKENHLQQEQCGSFSFEMRPHWGRGPMPARRRRRRKHSANVHFARLQGINP